MVYYDKIPRVEVKRYEVIGGKKVETASFPVSDFFYFFMVRCGS